MVSNAPREPREDDAERVLEAFLLDPQMSRQGDVDDIDSALRYIRRFTANPEDMRALVAVDDEDQLMALAAVAVDTHNLSGWVFYWCHPEGRGRGITSALVTTLANRELSSGGLDRLELGYRVNNPASGKVARKAGFIQEGVERQKFLIEGERIDVATCARLRSDPFPSMDRDI